MNDKDIESIKVLAAGLFVILLAIWYVTCTLSVPADVPVQYRELLP